VPKNAVRFSGRHFLCGAFQFSPSVVPVLVPPSVELGPVPSYTEYRYAVVNDCRVIIEPRTRKIIKIID
jgi:hypothetical protein